MDKQIENLVENIFQSIGKEVYFLTFDFCVHTTNLRTRINHGTIEWVYSSESRCKEVYFKVRNSDGAHNVIRYLVFFTLGQATDALEKISKRYGKLISERIISHHDEGIEFVRIPETSNLLVVFGSLITGSRIMDEAIRTFRFEEETNE